MSETDPRADTPPMNESDVGVSELPTGTVTLLLADIEGSTRLWETQPQEMAQAVARLDRALAEMIAAHGGVRPVEQGEGDSLVVAFDRASDAVACALDLQLAPAGADPAADRSAHRRGPIARRGQLHRADHQQDRTPARLGARRADRPLGCNRRDRGRPLATRRLAASAGQPPAARSSPRRAGHPAVPSRPAQPISTPASALPCCQRGFHPS